VVGDRKRAEFQVVSAFGEFVQAASGIEQRILGVKMQMDKIYVRRHGENLRRVVDAAQVEGGARNYKLRSFANRRLLTIDD
jgi:hypothetical protein